MAFIQRTPGSRLPQSWIGVEGLLQQELQEAATDLVVARFANREVDRAFLGGGIKVDGRPDESERRCRSSDVGGQDQPGLVITFDDGDGTAQRETQLADQGLSILVVLGLFRIQAADSCEYVRRNQLRQIQDRKNVGLKSAHFCSFQHRCGKLHRVHTSGYWVTKNSSAVRPGCFRSRVAIEMLTILSAI